MSALWKVPKPASSNKPTSQLLFINSVLMEFILLYQNCTMLAAGYPTRQSRVSVQKISGAGRRSVRKATLRKLPKNSQPKKVKRLVYFLNVFTQNRANKYASPYTSQKPPTLNLCEEIWKYIIDTLLPNLLFNIE